MVTTGSMCTTACGSKQSKHNKVVNYNPPAHDPLLP